MQPLPATQQTRLPLPPPPRSAFWTFRAPFCLPPILPRGRTALGIVRVWATLAWTVRRLVTRHRGAPIRAFHRAVRVARATPSLPHATQHRPRFYSFQHSYLPPHGFATFSLLSIPIFLFSARVTPLKRKTRWRRPPFIAYFARASACMVHAHSMLPFPALQPTKTLQELYHPFLLPHAQQLFPPSAFLLLAAHACTAVGLQPLPACYALLTNTTPACHLLPFSHASW